MSNRKTDDSVTSSFAYSVDKTGNRTKLTLSNGDYAEYLYDQTYQLTREHRKDSQNATLYYNNFFYDPAGNRTRLEYNDGTGTTTTSYLYNTGDQLTKETVGETVTSYLYDANGNLTKKDDGTNVHAYGYDFRNLMTDYDGPGSNNDTTYRYDALGRRVTKDVNGTKTAYVHDGLDTVAEYNGSNQLQRTYVTPGLDQNLSLTASGNTYYYLSDALGSIRQVLDADQSTQDSYDYEAFGRVYGSPTENLTQPFRFTGREWDPEGSLYYYRARNYAAAPGRFLQRDLVDRPVAQVSAPIGIPSDAVSRPRTRPGCKMVHEYPIQATDGPNLYLYCRSDPANRVDATGRLSKTYCLFACIPAGKFYFECFDLCCMVCDIVDLEKWWNDHRSGEDICEDPSAWQDCPKFCPEGVSFRRDCLECCLTASRTYERGQDDIYRKCTDECERESAAMAVAQIEQRE